MCTRPLTVDNAPLCALGVRAWGSTWTRIVTEFSITVCLCCRRCRLGGILPCSEVGCFFCDFFLSIFFPRKPSLTTLLMSLVTGYIAAGPRLTPPGVFAAANKEAIRTPGGEHLTEPRCPSTSCGSPSPWPKRKPLLPWPHVSRRSRRPRSTARWCTLLHTPPTAPSSPQCLFASVSLCVRVLWVRL